MGEWLKPEVIVAIIGAMIAIVAAIFASISANQAKRSADYAKIQAKAASETVNIIKRKEQQAYLVGEITVTLNSKLKVRKRLTINNLGEGTAFNVRFTVDDIKPEDHESLSLFYKEIDHPITIPSKGCINIDLIITFNRPLPKKIKINWDDDYQKNNETSQTL
jgi:hypothetical protein